MKRWDVRRRNGELFFCPTNHFREADEEKLYEVEIEEGDQLALVQLAIVVSIVVTVVEAGLAKDEPTVKDISECPGFTPALRELLKGIGRCALMFRASGGKKKKAPKAD